MASVPRHETVCWSVLAFVYADYAKVSTFARKSVRSVHYTGLSLTTQNSEVILSRKKIETFRVSEMAFSPFWGRFQITNSKIETDPNHPPTHSSAFI
jgi:hypothetical protein